jgi:NADH-quinone oxidoreductase subunit M
MFNHIPLLSLLIWLPVIGAVLVLWAHKNSGVTTARYIALFVSLIMLLLCVPLYAHFDNNTAAMQFQEHVNWIPSFQINYDLGVDGISLPLIILSCFTTVMVVLASWSTVHEKVGQYLAAFLIMQGMVVGVFASLDSILFYFFWEAMLIPMYLSIGIWGGKNRSYAAMKFFLYTFLGSALLLLALLYLHQLSGSFAILKFYTVAMSMHVQEWLFWAFLLAFAVKVPMWPLHTWLPDAHTEAPAGGSVVLAALMLKMGAYGFLRFTLPIVPDASVYFSPLMIVLSLIAIVYTSFVACAQTDMKRLIAYSSVAHMGFVTLGCFMIYLIMVHTGSYFTAYMSIEGGMVQMITHAFGSGAMFLGFGILYQQFKTRDIENFGGIAHTMPIFTAFFVLYAMANVGLPFTSGFVGEFMVILSSFRGSFWVAFLAATSLILGAVYTLWMVKRVFYGPIKNDGVAALTDVRGYDLVVFAVLGACIIIIGVYPAPLLNMMHASVGNLLHLARMTHLPGQTFTIN